MDGRLVSQAAVRLTRVERLVVEMHHADRLTPAEIAAVLGQTEGYVLAVLAAAHDKVRGLVRFDAA